MKPAITDDSTPRRPELSYSEDVRATIERHGAPYMGLFAGFFFFASKEEKTKKKKNGD